MPLMTHIHDRTGAAAGAGGVQERRHPVGAHRVLQQHGHLVDL